MGVLGLQKSQRLAELAAKLDNDDWDTSDFVDATSTAGYDNDGSTGPELFDNGVEFALAAYRYDSSAQLFYAYSGDDDFVYYQFGKDEEDACRRLQEAVADCCDANGLANPLANPE